VVCGDPQSVGGVAGSTDGGADCPPISCIGVLAGHDFKTDTWRDVSMSIEAVKRFVIWTRRVFRDTPVTRTYDGIRIGLTAPIVEED
jgi:hypothetical protein